MWYAFRPTANARVQVDTRGSDYDTTASVYLGGPGALAAIGCNDDAAFDGVGTLQSRFTFDAVAGVTYYIMIGAYGSGPGGYLALAVTGAAPSSISQFRLSGVAVLDPATHSSILTGTISCPPGTTLQISGETLQKHGHSAARAISSTTVTCSGETTVQIAAALVGAPLRTGKAVTTLRIQAYDPISWELVDQHVTSSIRVRR